jgi:hypothetical protein
LGILELEVKNRRREQDIRSNAEKRYSTPYIKPFVLFLADPWQTASHDTRQGEKDILGHVPILCHPCLDLRRRVSFRHRSGRLHRFGILRIFRLSPFMPFLPLCLYRKKGGVTWPRPRARHPPRRLTAHGLLASISRSLVLLFVVRSILTFVLLTFCSVFVLLLSRRARSRLPRCLYQRIFPA